MPALYFSLLVVQSECENRTPLANGFLALCVIGLEEILDIIKGS